MVELVPAVCPKCGANLQLPENLERAHCMYCGTEIIIEIKKPDIHYHGTGSVENYFKLGDIAVKGGDYQSAVGYYGKVLELDTNNVDAWLKKAAALSNLTKYDEALACCDAAINLSPNATRMQVREEIVSKYIDWIIEKVDELSKEEQKEFAPIISDPTFIGTLMGTKRINAIKERYSKEIFKLLDKGLSFEKGKNNAELWKLKGVRLNFTYKPEEAKACFNRAKEIDPYIKTGPCFIATAAYGTPMAQEINVLRQWRDETLIKTTSGRALVKIYYTISPPVADFISTSERLKAITRLFVNPFVHFAGVST